MKTGKTLETSNTVHYGNGLIKEEDNKQKIESNVRRYADLYQKDERYYAMDYGDRFNPKVNEKTGKIEYSPDSTGRRPFWFVDNVINTYTYWQHLEQVPNRDWGLILPPIHAETNLCKFGAIDVDIYNKPEELKRIVEEIYSKKLSLVPCFSKSSGLHLYIFFKDLVPASALRKYLISLNKKLKINAKEVFPKQTELKYNEKKKKFEIGNGILLPYKSSIHSSKGHYTDCKNVWIKNSNMEHGDLEEFLDYAESMSLVLDELPIEIKEKKVDPVYEIETREFKELAARPLHDNLKKILKRIREKKDHDRGGTFDNHVVDFIYGGVRESYSDREIIENFKDVWQYADKEGDTYQGMSEEDYIRTRITNCRDKFGIENPGELKNMMMGNLIFNKSSDKFKDQSTGGDYTKGVVDTVYSHLFPKKMTAMSYFNNNPNKQMAESEIYRPDLFEEGKILVKNKKDNLYYINSYKPGEYPPIKPNKIGDLKLWNEMLEFLVEKEVEREYLLDWLAFMIQHPWVKIQSIILLLTKHQRMGKGSIFDVMTDILGKSNAEPTDVNGIMDKGITFAEKQFILVDEVKSKGNHAETKLISNAIKKLATEQRLSQRRLYADAKVIETHTNYMLNTNNLDAVNLDKEDDRFFIISNYKVRKPQKFYDDFHAWRIEIGSSYVHYLLKHRNLSNFNHKAPPPRTQAKADMIGEVGHPLTLVLKEWIEEGQHPFQLDENVRGSSELADWISKHGRGDYVRFANNPKILAQCLEEAGCFKVGQAYNDKFNIKATLWLYGDYGQLKNKTPKQLTNENWKPLITTETRVQRVEATLTKDLNDRDPNDHRTIEFENQQFNKNRQTNCWSCKTPISESGDGICPECDYAIKCSCGKCACDKPGSKIKKKGAYEAE